MAGRLTIRSIPDEVLTGLETLATRHDRPLEGEARFALRSWVESLLLKQERSMRRAEVSARLRELLQAVNSTRQSPFLKPSHIAEKIGESHVEDVERWFAGESEPSLTQLSAVAEYLGGVSAWLRHGDEQPFPVQHQRIPEDPAEAVEWLLDVQNGTPEVMHLHLVRCTDETGQLAVVKQYKEWRCSTHITPCHVSAENGSTGWRTLASLTLTLRLLYETNAKSISSVYSYLMDRDSFMKLSRGRTHPLVLIDKATRTPWWEDLWDAEPRSRKREYWPGWQGLCEDIAANVELTPHHTATQRT